MISRSGRWETAVLITLLICWMPFAAGLTIEEPSRDAYTEVPIIPLKVQTDTAYEKISYRIDTGRLTACACNGKTVWLEPGEGQHNLTVTGERPDGSTETRHTTFTLDTEPPKITGVVPGGDLYDRRPVFNLSAHDSQTRITAVSASANETAMTVQELDDERYRLRPQHALEDGEHTLQVTVTDVVGHTATKTLAFAIPAAPSIERFDPPTITPFLRPAIALTVREPDRLDLAGSSLRVERLSDGSTQQYVFAARDAAETGSTYRLQTRPELTDGERYRMTAHIEDEDGNIATETWTTTVDLQPPPVRVSVEPGAHLRGTTSIHITSTDTVTDGILSIGGISRSLAIADGTDTIHLDTRNLRAGNATLQTEVFDTAGNVGISTVPVVIDNMPPRITHTAITRHSDDSAALMIAAEDDAVSSEELAVRTDAGVLTRLNTSGSTALFALKGVNEDSVRILVSDRAGNTVEKRLTIPGSAVRQRATFGNRSSELPGQHSMSVDISYPGSVPAMVLIRRTTPNSTRSIGTFKVAPNASRQISITVAAEPPFTLEAVDTVSGAVIAQRTYRTDSDTATTPTGRIGSAQTVVSLVVILLFGVLTWRYRAVFLRSLAAARKNISAYRRRP